MPRSERPFAAYTGDEPYIFVSYAHDDADTVYPEIQWLHDQGFNLWYDEGISPGSEWHQELARRIDGASLFLYFITPRSAASPHCEREVHYAIDNDKQLLAVHLEETELPAGVSLSLGNMQAIMRSELSDLDYRIKLLKGASQHTERGIGAAPGKAPSPSKRLATLAGFAGLLAGAIVAAALLWDREPAGVAPKPLKRFALALPEGVRLPAEVGQPLAFSPDGSSVVINGEEGGQSILYARALDAIVPVPLRHPTDGKSDYVDQMGAIDIGGMTFSPDGEWIAFVDVADGALKKMRASGGGESTIGRLDSSRRLAFSSLSWGATGTLVFSVSGHPGLMRVPDVGGTPESLTTPEAGEFHDHPHFLPDGETLLFKIGPRGHVASPEDRIALLHANGEQEVLITGAAPRYVASGHLVFYRENALWAAAFDLGTKSLRGAPAPVVEDVQYQHDAVFSVATDGSLVYLQAVDRYDDNTLVWIDRDGRETPIDVPDGRYRTPRVSPNGDRVAVTVNDDPYSDVWVYSFARKTLTRLTFEEADKWMPVWTPDGSGVVYSANPDGGRNLYRKASDGTGAVERLTSSDRTQFATSWVSESQPLVLYTCSGPGACDLATLSVGAESGAALLLESSAQDWHPALSPDGTLLAYASDESGRYEVYVRPFPDIEGGKWQVSTSGGTQPVWGPDGREIYYWGPTHLMAVAVETDPVFVPGTPHSLFELKDHVFHAGRNYSVSPDGARFLLLKPAGGAKPPQQLILVQNWFEELERLVPTR